MVIETSLPSAGLAVAAILGSGYFLAVMWSRRREPTARPLFGLAATLAGTAVLHLLHVHLTPTHTVLARRVSEDFADVFWISAVLTSYIAVLGLWTVFVFTYTGRGTWVTRLVAATVGGLFVLEAGSLFLVATGIALTTRVVEAILVVSLVLVLVLAIVGVFLVLDEATRLGPLLVREAAVLSLAAGTLFGSAWLFLRFNSPPVFTGSVLVSSLLFVFAIRHYSMFESLPLAGVLGRERVIREMTEGIVVVGQDGQIQDLNPAAQALFGVDSDRLLGEDWSVLVPGDFSLDELTQTDQSARVELAETVVAINATVVTDEQGRSLGHLVVCQDITDRRERERRLAVLNRFLVETVSERMETLESAADDIADSPANAAESGTEIWTTTTNLITLLTYVREVERGLADDDTQRSDVATIADSVIEDSPAVIGDRSPPPAAIEPPLLESVLELLVSDGVDTPTEAIDVTIEATGEAVEVTLNAEDTTANALRETALELARLTVESAGGTVRTASESDAGKRAGLVTIQLPAADEPGTEGESTTVAGRVGGEPP
jgi:PAS domain S-box-containing protein